MKQTTKLCLVLSAAALSIVGLILFMTLGAENYIHIHNPAEKQVAVQNVIAPIGDKTNTGDKNNSTEGTLETELNKNLIDVHTVMKVLLNTIIMSNKTKEITENENVTAAGTVPVAKTNNDTSVGSRRNMTIDPAKVDKNITEENTGNKNVAAAGTVPAAGTKDDTSVGSRRDLTINPAKVDKNVTEENTGNKDLPKTEENMVEENTGNMSVTAKTAAGTKNNTSERGESTAEKDSPQTEDGKNLLRLLFDFLRKKIA